MENKLAQVFQIDSEEWLATLPKYQQNRIKQLVDSTNSYEEAAKQWLNAMPENTFPLGAEQAKNVFIEKVRDEIEKFLSGNEKYADEQQLVSSSEVLQKTFVSSVSAAIAPAIGIATAYVMPVIVLELMTMSKIADRAVVIAGQTSNAVFLSEADLVDDMRWDQSFSRSPDVLAKLAATAMAEYHAGKTQELDPETL
ncbi:MULTISPECIES: hypothetical protein [unclassified Microcoleus]|uniref:hypothetical protein n=1 Tax=unclassified Microcoleus TaxID=2642155 RepID=UPI0025FE0EA7|nr:MULTISPECIES: hypothetical protein [unclassified Microcoleus]